jgi:hypothetical protein
MSLHFARRTARSEALFCVWVWISVLKDTTQKAKQKKKPENNQKN